MTFQKITAEGLSDDENDLVNALLKQLHDRERGNTRRQEYYDADRPLRRISSVVPPQYHRLGLVLGWSAKAVDALARRCVTTGFEWSDGDLDALGMDALSEDNMLLSELSGARTKALIHGVSFLINTTGAEGEPRSLIHAKDALNATGFWSTRTRTLESLVSVTDRDGDGDLSGLALYREGLTIPIVKSDGVWTVVDRQEHAYGMPAEAMIYRPQGRPFGYSRITRPIRGLQDAAVRALIRMEGHMDIYSYPELWMLGADLSIFKNTDGSAKAPYEVMMGRVKGIPDDENADQPRADVKQFSASSPEPHLAQLNALSKLMAREASLPDSSVAITDFSNPTSAESYDASQYELIAEAEGAIDDFTRPEARSVRRGLAILNGVEQPDEWRSILPSWRNPKYESRTAMADAGTKIALAVPGMAETDVGLELMGLTPDQIKRFRSERTRASGRATLDALIAGEPDASGA